jgi:hypothetical protein
LEPDSAADENVGDAAAAPPAPKPLWLRLLAYVAVAVVAAGLGSAVTAALLADDPAPQRIVVAATPVEIVVPDGVAEYAASELTTDVYAGLGAWLDAFDFSPAYSADGVPPVRSTVVSEMADQGIETLYLQAARLDERSPDVLEDRWVLAEYLLRARQEGVAVVGWYLPFWRDDDADFGRLAAIADFRFLGLAFDGVGVDIEWNQDGLEPEVRSARLVRLSQRLRDHVGEDPLGAIVLPPVLTEVVNPNFWPAFPWDEIAPLYDAWLPMSYWSFRSEASGYGNGYSYNEESTRRLRNNVGDPDAIVHGIGGIGAVPPDQVDAASEPLASSDQLENFVRSLTDTGSVGGSIYDWLTQSEDARAEMRRLFTEAGLVP